jgi:signal transduction histidine kinase
MAGEKTKVTISDSFDTSFMSKMGHDMRNPINIILGYTSLILDSNILTETHREDLEAVQSSAESLLNIVNNYEGFVSGSRWSQSFAIFT